MGVLGESWCFCSGGGKSERLKATIFSTKSAAMARLSTAAGEVAGSGFLLGRRLLLTTHVNLPSAAAAESTEIRLHNDVVATPVPQRFFITSSVLDLTIVGIDSTESDSSSPTTHPHSIKTCSNPILNLGSIVYILGYTPNNKQLTVDEGKVVIATDNLIKLSTQGVNWSSGSAGFDSQGNLAFMICDPMKLATSPYTKSSPSTTSKGDRETMFAIPMPIICGWLNQHLEPKLPLMRLVSAKHDRHPSESSLITNQVFAKEAEDLNDDEFPSNEIIESHDDSKANVTAAIPKETSEIPLLGNESEAKIPEASTNAEEQTVDIGEENAVVSSSGSANGIQNEAKSSPCHVAGSKVGKGKDKMQKTSSVETAESRSNTSPREGSCRQPVGRVQKGASYNSRSPVVHNNKSLVEKRPSLSQPRKSLSQGGMAYRGNDYCSPTVSSIKKKRNANLEKAKPASKIRQKVVSSPPRWVI